MFCVIYLNVLEKYIPYIIESTYGLDRTILAILFNAYHEDTLEDGTTREVLSLHPFIAPYKVLRYILPIFPIMTL